MASVNFPAGVGGDGSTVTDDANPTTGLANGGHRTRFVPALAQVVAVAQNTVTKATEAAASALTAVNAPGTSGTSTTSIAVVASGTVSPTTQTGKAWVVGQPVVISRTSAPATTQMYGIISAYNSGTGAMSIAVSQSKGSGTYTDWTIGLTGAPAPQYSLVAVTGNVTLVANANDYFVTANAVMTFPSSPAVGDTIPFRLARAPSVLTAVSFARSGSNIMGLAEDFTVDIPYLAGEWKYVDATFGWSLR